MAILVTVKCFNLHARSTPAAALVQARCFTDLEWAATSVTVPPSQVVVYMIACPTCPEWPPVLFLTPGSAGSRQDQPQVVAHAHIHLE